MVYSKRVQKMKSVEDKASGCCLAANCQAAKRKEKGIGQHPTPHSWQNLGNFPIQPL
jgi:hypothetical protein